MERREISIDSPIYSLCLLCALWYNDLIAFSFESDNADTIKLGGTQVPELKNNNILYSLALGFGPKLCNGTTLLSKAVTEITVCVRTFSCDQLPE